MTSIIINIIYKTYNIFLTIVINFGNKMASWTNCNGVRGSYWYLSYETYVSKN